MKLVLAMPGNKDRLDLQEAFWQRGIVDTGLEPRTELCFQANGKWGETYPDELLAELTPDHIALEQYHHTRVRFDDGFQPKPYTYCLLDYEPDKTIEGQRTTWLGDKLTDGYHDADIEVLTQIRRGVQEATDGLPLGAYRTPVLPKRAIIIADKHRASTADNFAESLDWHWFHCYPQGEIRISNIQAYGRQLESHFRTLSRYGMRVIPWLWPSYRLDEHEAEMYARWTLPILSRLPGIDTIGIWVDLNSPTHAETQTKNMQAIAPRLLELMEAA